MTAEKLLTMEDELDLESKEALLTTSWTESGVGEKEAEMVTDLWRKGVELPELHAMK